MENRLVKAERKGHTYGYFILTKIVSFFNILKIKLHNCITNFHRLC